MREIVLGTRGSELARWQARWVAGELRRLYPDLRIGERLIRTTGDKMHDVALARLGGKGLFTKELEISLLQGEIDLAVHSLKDMPTSLPEGLALAAVTRREDPRDVYLSRTGMPWAELPAGATIGTSSLRRKAQLMHWRPDVKLIDWRGNLQSRWQKMQEKRVDGIILAAAGVLRMGWKERITEFLAPEICLPAVGQGALAVETRADDVQLLALLQPLNHGPTAAATRAERSFLEALEGGCQIPIGALAVLADQELELQGVVASLDGRQVLRGSVTGPAEQAAEVGRRLADDLLEQGAAGILNQIRERQVRGKGVNQ